MSGRITLGLILFALSAVSIFAAETTPKVLELGTLAGRLDHRLIPAVRALEDGSATGVQLTRAQAGWSGTVADAPPGLLALELNVPAIDLEILEKISATGAWVRHSNARWASVSVLATIEEAAALARIDGVRSVKFGARSARRAQQGIAHNQADVTQHADVARNATGLSGKGQKIGVLSDSFNDNLAVGAGVQSPAPTGKFVDGTNPQMTGDLPAKIHVIDFGPGFGSDEGEAMMELIHDIAPGAALAFASGNGSHVEYAENIRKLRQAGCTITCDDLFYFDEPCFQDGPIAQNINANFDAGVPHFSAAGNSADNGLTATYVPVNPANTVDNSLPFPDGQDFHNWGLGGATPGFLPITVPPGQDVLAMMQWNQPYESYNLGPGASVDMDFLLFDAPSVTTGVLLAGGGESQFANNLPQGDPFEIFQYINNTGATQTVYLTVNHYSGSRINTVFRVIFLSRYDALSYPSGGVSGATMYGHSAAAKTFSVGAIFFADIDSNGQWGPDVSHINAERFTSKGGLGANGIQYFFDGVGNPLAGGPVKVDKPDFLAVDGGNTSVFGNDISLLIGGVIYDDDDFGNFFGTSAAAPNAAAIAALALERATKTTPSQLRAAMKASAHDVVSVIPFSDFGPDDISGAGWVDAAALVSLVPGILDHPDDATLDPGQTTTFSVTATGSPALSYRWLRGGTPIANETSSSLQLTPVLLADDGATFTCQVSNAFGSALSFAGTLKVNPPPKINLHPQNQSVNEGVTAQFSVLAVNGNLSYQWRRGGMDIPGAIFSSYALIGAALTDDGAQFSCLVTNSAGNALSNPAVLTVKPRPMIISQPGNQTVTEGDSAFFAVTAMNGNLFYQWRRNGVEIPGALEPTYDLPVTTLQDSGAIFQCLVSNAAGNTLSLSAVLTVLPPPRILSGLSASPPIVAAGQTVTFSVTAVETLNQGLEYSWDFGDGTSEPESDAASIEHVYDAPGTYAIKVQITDVLGGKSFSTVEVFVYVDGDGDGQPALDESADNSSFADTVKRVKGLSAVKLPVSKLAIKLNFAKPGSDTLTLAGTLSIPREILLANQRIQFVIGGVGREFTLGSAGEVALGDATTLRFKSFKNRSPEQTVKYQLSIKNAELKAYFVDELLLNQTVARGERAVRATVFFNGVLYDVLRPQIYSARQGRLGRTK